MNAHRKTKYVPAQTVIGTTPHLALLRSDWGGWRGEGEGRGWVDEQGHRHPSLLSACVPKASSWRGDGRSQHMLQHTQPVPGPVRRTQKERKESERDQKEREERKKRLLAITCAKPLTYCPPHFFGQPNPSTTSFPTKKGAHQRVRRINAPRLQGARSARNNCVLRL